MNIGTGWLQTCVKHVKYCQLIDLSHVLEWIEDINKEAGSKKIPADPWNIPNISQNTNEGLGVCSRGMLEFSRTGASLIKCH